MRLNEIWTKSVCEDAAVEGGKARIELTHRLGYLVSEHILEIALEVWNVDDKDLEKELLLLDDECLLICIWMSKVAEMAEAAMRVMERRVRRMSLRREECVCGGGIGWWWWRGDWDWEGGGWRRPYSMGVGLLRGSLGMWDCCCCWV